ncbi:MAG: tripartite tricarboxylate transporter substrate binding protein [Betaproteobacteria bacterium]|nr:tripartite tricarboxylate transporter substrate binding protein [Betaproteobacteria bacterium]
MVPFPPGGGTDAISRILGQRLGESLGQQVVVDNRSGAGGIVGTNIIATAVSDGHTIGMVSSAHSINPALYEKLPYDSVKSFAPITLVAHGLYVVAVHPALPAKSMQELIAYAKANPGKINVALAGAGSAGHLAMEQLKSTYGINLTGVLYRGSGPAVTDLVAGQVQLLFASFPSVQQLIAAGRLRALAATSAKRSPVAPDLPTAAEAGIPNFIVGESYGMVAPAGTDRAIIARLNSDIVKALAVPEVRDRLLGLGAEIVGGTPQEFGVFLQAEIDKAGKVVRQAGIKVE